MLTTTSCLVREEAAAKTEREAEAPSGGASSGHKDQEEVPPGGASLGHRYQEEAAAKVGREAEAPSGGASPGHRDPGTGVQEAGEAAKTDQDPTWIKAAAGDQSDVVQFIYLNLNPEHITETS